MATTTHRADAATVAGTSITNRASVSYLDSDSGYSSTLESNTVTAIVQPLEAFQIVPSQSIQSPTGAPINLSHRITNTGNTPSSYTFTVSNSSGDDYDIAGLKIYQDLNGNGVADPGEPQMGDQSPLLAPSASLQLVVNGVVPAGLAGDLNAKVQLTATSVLQNVKLVNTDNVTVTKTLSLQVLKSASRQTARSGDTVDFVLTAMNRGNSGPLPASVVVDGANRQLVVLRDTVPANTSLVKLQSSSFGQLLYHRLGDAEQSYITSPPTDLNSVDAIAFANTGIAARTTLQGVFTVQLHPNINGDLHNTAHLFFIQPGDTTTSQIDSNETVVSVPVTPPTITYYTEATFDRVAVQTDFSRQLHIEVKAARCNFDPASIEKIVVTVTSFRTGDVQQFTATESAPNSGIFRVDTQPIVESNNRSTNEHNGIVETMSNDVLTAWASCNGDNINTTILVDPLGVVYDSRSNAPVAGAKVTLIDVTGVGNGGQAGQNAKVFLGDGTTPAPSSVTTGVNGTFQFPLVNPSTYRLVVVPPANYDFPSKIAPGLQPTGRLIDVSGSYGGNFLVSIAGGTVRLDVPLDTPQSGPAGLFLEKTTERHQVDMGDFVDYKISLKNNTGVALTGAIITDTLPVGFKYRSGTARLNGAALEPTNSGSSLVFAAGNLAIDQESDLTYRALVGPGTKIGKNVNRARATANSGASPTASNEGSAAVDVQGGVFDDRSFILGRIFVDLNRDGEMQAGEPGIPGVRIYLEDGTFVLTDEDGKYSFYGVTPRTHIVKIDVTSLPTGTQLEPLTPRHSLNGQTYWLDLKKDELGKVNFADRAATKGILTEVRARRVIASKSENEAFIGLKTTLTPDGAALLPGDVRSLPSSGFVGNSGTALESGIHAQPLNEDNSNLPSAPVRPVPSVDLESLLPGLTPELGFIGLKDGDTLPIAQANLRVKGKPGSQFKLSVNGTEIPQSRVGLKATSADSSLEAWEYVGIKLQPGHNALEVDEVDSFGIARGKSSISVIAPGDLGHLEVTVPAQNQAADGHSAVKIKVRLTDDKGATVSSRTPVTLEATCGQWQVSDLNPNEPGVQVFIDGGSAEFTLISPTDPGNCVVRATSGLLKGTSSITFVPELRPLLVTGLVTSKVNLFGFRATGANSIRTEDIFDDEDKNRAAIFAKGRILGQDLLTLRYDSQKKEDDPLFRDIQPDAYYPIYGDSSARGFDAQSTSKLYVRVDQNKSYVLYGDYTTAQTNPARSLGEYSRSFTGLTAHRETNRLTANVFVSHDNQRQIIDEIRGNGTSGAYLLRSGDIVDQSEKVEIIVRDRNQPSVVLSVTPQTRFLDYQLDSLSSGILFRSPISSVDANLNPVFVRVTYEVEQGGPNFTVSGGDAQYKLTQKLEVGGSWANDRNPQAPYSLHSMNATYHFAPNTTLVGEWAQSDNAGARGGAQRVELLHEGEKLTARLFWGRSDTQFDNAASLLSQGRQEASMKATYKINDTNRIVAEALRSVDVTSNDNRLGAQVSLEHSFPNNVRAEVGIRRVKDTGTASQPQDPTAAPADFTSLRAKITAQVPGAPQASVFTEYERAVQGSGQALTVGGDYQLANRGRLYLRHELISSLSGRYGLDDTEDQHTTLIGMDSDYMKNGRVFSEYRIGGGISARDAEASIGVRNAWSLGEGMKFNTTFERIRSMGGTTGNDSTAVTGAFEYTRDPNFKGTARLEVRNGDTSDSVLGTLGMAYKINPDVTFLGKGVYSRTSSAAQAGVDLSSQNQERVVMGLSYRSSKNDRLNALLKYEFRQDTGALTTRLRRRAQIVSANANYQAGRRWDLSGHYAAKVGYDQSHGLTDSTLIQQLSGRATYNVGRRTDISFLSSLLRGNGTTQYGLGAELGFRLTSSLRVSAGYLLGHFRDNDLTDANSSDSGFYLHFGYQFDDGSLEGDRP